MLFPSFHGSDDLHHYPLSNIDVVPVFGDENDCKAIEIIKEAFPEREVVCIGCREMVYGLGSLHCVSQQQPAK